jgi:hypothetical protein
MYIFSKIDFFKNFTLVILPTRIKFQISKNKIQMAERSALSTKRLSQITNHKSQITKGRALCAKR